MWKKQTLILIKTLSCMIIFLLGCGKYSELLSKTGSMCLFKIQFYSIRSEYFQLDCDFIYVLHSTSFGHLKEEEEKSLLIFKGLSIYILLQQTLKCTSYEKDSKIEIRFKQELNKEKISGYDWERNKKVITRSIEINSCLKIT